MRLLDRESFNYIFNITMMIIDIVNCSISDYKYIIKGGACVKYYFDKNNIDSTDLTYDIDIAPICINTDLEKIWEYNSNLSNIIIKYFTSKHKNVVFTKKIHNKLITIQMQKMDVQGIMKTYDIIDLSYVDTHDADSLFVTAINKIHGSFDNFYSYFIGKDDSLSDPNIELYVANNGYAVYKNYIKSVDTWKLNMQSIRNELDVMKMHSELFGDDDSAEKIELYTGMIKQYEHQTSEEYVNNMRNKLERYEKKIKGLEMILSIESKSQ